MDPQITLFNLLESISRNDREEIEEHLENLMEWNRKGGFLPFVKEINHMGDTRAMAVPSKMP